MTLHQPGVLCDIGLVLLQLFNFFTDLGKNISYGLVGAAADAIEEGMTGLYVQFYRCHACTVLSAVMLLFHQQVQFIEPVGNRTVLLQVIRKWFSKPYKCQSAFMFYLVAHTEGRKVRKKLPTGIRLLVHAGIG